MRSSVCTVELISIHALREEGDSRACATSSSGR